MASNYITIDEYLKLPLSEALRQALYDITTFAEQGVEIYMSSWYKISSKGICSVCLGGAALLSFMTRGQLIELVNDKNFDPLLNMNSFSRACRVLNIDDSEGGPGDKIARVMNNLRVANTRLAADQWYEKSSRWISSEQRLALIKIDKNADIFYGSVPSWKFNSFIASMSKLADKLAKIGL